ncbi:hypothetical protein VPH35_039481 [Triticum aestivum]
MAIYFGPSPSPYGCCFPLSPPPKIPQSRRQGQHGRLQSNASAPLIRGFLGDIHHVYFHEEFGSGFPRGWTEGRFGDMAY